MAFFAGFTLERRYGLSRQPAASWLRDHAKAAARQPGLRSARRPRGRTAGSRPLAGWWWLAGVGRRGRGRRRRGLGRARSCCCRSSTASRRCRTAACASGCWRWRRRRACRPSASSSGALSDRTSRANAALTGIGRTRRIIVSDTLLARLPGRRKSRSSWPTSWPTTCTTTSGGRWRSTRWWPGGLAWRPTRRCAAPPGRSGLQGLSDSAGLPVAGLTMTAVGWLASPLANAGLARARAPGRPLRPRPHPERRTRLSAPCAASAPGTSPRSPRRSLARLFFHTHPPIAERIAFAGAWASGQRTRAARPAVG